MSNPFAKVAETTVSRKSTYMGEGNFLMLVTKATQGKTDDGNGPAFIVTEGIVIKNYDSAHPVGEEVTHFTLYSSKNSFFAQAARTYTALALDLDDPNVNYKADGTLIDWPEESANTYGKDQPLKGRVIEYNNKVAISKSTGEEYVSKKGSKIVNVNVIKELTTAQIEAEVDESVIARYADFFAPKHQ